MSGWGGSYERTTPKAVTGGIKASAKRTAMGGSQWWAKRWILALEKVMDSGRLTRGRSYARKGQVISLDIDGDEAKSATNSVTKSATKKQRSAKGAEAAVAPPSATQAEASMQCPSARYGTRCIVRAKVQGSRVRPYSVEIRLEPLSPEAWSKVVDVLATRAVFAALLLAGQMPPDIEQVFAQARLELFPGSRGELISSCSCPDWANPCKHVAAVYYLLGEEFDRDPFLLFRLRGMPREALLAGLGAASGAVSQSRGDGWELRPVLAADTADLPTDPESFWHGQRAVASAEAAAPAVAGPSAPGASKTHGTPAPGSLEVLQALGPFPLWRGELDVNAILAQGYSRGQVAGREVLVSLHCDPEG